MLRNLLLASILVIYACSSINTYQSAQSLDIGNFIIGGGPGFLMFPEQNGSDIALFGDFFFRLGFAPRSELGLRFTIPLSVMMDLKGQIIDLDRYDLAINLGGGCDFSEQLNLFSDDNNSYPFFTGLILHTFTISHRLSITFGPKIIFAASRDLVGTPNI
ncbi:MAG: hypothetical protein GX556_07170 [Fibrobacter sp.]|nr:hypothetical protein [Fibrobacter sp.]